MRRRMLKILFVVVLALPLSGCPGIASIAFGVWIFSVATNGSPNPALIELAILQNGVSVNPPSSYPGNYGIFGGPVTWQQNGSSVSFFNDVGPGYAFNGTAQSSTSMSGTWQEVGDPSYGGTWSAEWDPDS